MPNPTNQHGRTAVSDSTSARPISERTHRAVRRSGSACVSTRFDQTAVQAAHQGQSKYQQTREATREERGRGGPTTSEPLWGYAVGGRWGLRAGRTPWRVAHKATSRLRRSGAIEGDDVLAGLVTG
jgi:hypothetical protein